MESNGLSCLLVISLVNRLRLFALLSGAILQLIFTTAAGFYQLLVEETNSLWELSFICSW